MKRLLNEKSLWYQGLSDVLDENISKKLWDELSVSAEKIYPPKEKIFSAFHQTPLHEVKVVILGQDPYHGAGQANGLAFSVEKGVKLPPSLRNIYEEMSKDCGVDVPDHGDLTNWAKQGVLLLNTVLTVESGKANSHRGMGWESVTDRAISMVNDLETPVVFIFWGNPAIKKQSFVTNSHHLVLTSPHPSPLSSYRGFFGSRPFSKTNEFLKKNGIEEIDWNL